MPAPISTANLESMSARFQDNETYAPCTDGDCSKGNNRVTQPWNDRSVYFNGAVTTAISALTLSAIATLAF